MRFTFSNLLWAPTSGGNELEVLAGARSDDRRAWDADHDHAAGSTGQILTG